LLVQFVSCRSKIGLMRLIKVLRDRLELINVISLCRFEEFSVLTIVLGSLFKLFFGNIS
jgi:hypothetical protein